MNKRPRLMMRRTVSMASLDGPPAAAMPLPSMAGVSSSPEGVSSGGGGSNFSVMNQGDAKVGLGILAALDKVSVPVSPPGAIIRSVNHLHHHHHHQPAFAFAAAASTHHHSHHQWVSVGGAGGLNAPRHTLSSHHQDRRSVFLESCFLCKRDISHGRDIYMYRGDRGFCSVECRQQQILNDERAERRQKCSQSALKQMGGTSQQSRVVNQRAKVAPATTAAAA